MISLSKLQRRPYNMLVLVAYAGVVFVASVLSPPNNGQELVTAGPFGLIGADKWAHAIGYGIFSAAIAHTFEARTSPTLVVAAVIAVAYGAGMEVVQAFVPYRSFSVGDLVANAFGALVGVALWTVFRQKLNT